MKNKGIEKQNKRMKNLENRDPLGFKEALFHAHLGLK